MKNHIVAFTFITVIASSVFAATPYRLGTLVPCTDGTTVAVSSETRTLLPASNCAGRTDVFLTNHATNTLNVGITISTSSVAVNEGLTVNDINIQPGSTTVLEVGSDRYIWGVTLPGGNNNNVHVKEYIRQ